MTFARLSPGRVAALVAALALILLLAADWYTTEAGAEARRIERLQQTARAESPTAESLSLDVERQASAAAEEAESNGWQADRPVDRVILVLVLAAIGLTIAGSFLIAADRPERLTAVAAPVALLGALLLLYRMLDPPGPGGQAQIGLVGAVIALVVIAAGSARALRAP